MAGIRTWKSCDEALLAHHKLRRSRRRCAWRKQEIAPRCQGLGQNEHNTLPVDTAPQPSPSLIVYHYIGIDIPESCCSCISYTPPRLPRLGPALPHTGPRGHSRAPGINIHRTQNAFLCRQVEESFPGASCTDERSANAPDLCPRPHADVQPHLQTPICTT